MKLYTIVIFIVVGLSCYLFSQSSVQVQDEANPQYQRKIDNSPSAQLWRQIIEARKAGDEELHKALLQRYKDDFSQKLSIGESPVEAPYAVLNSAIYPFDPNYDWGLGDVRIHPGNLSSGFITGNFRSAQVEADSLGNLYAACLNLNRDSLFVYKSTDSGLNWSLINWFFPGGTTLWHSFDFFITDTTGGHRLGFAAARTMSGSFDGEVWWMTIMDDGSDFRATLVQTRPAGRGLINPAIISDGYVWAPSISYWYVAYQDVDETSGDGNAAVAAVTQDWGFTWQLDSARSGFNDFELDIDYNFGADTIHVLLTNDITPTNPNLRVRSVALADFATSSSWTQANVASTANPESFGCLVANRQSNELLVTYTVEVSGNENIGHSYNPTGNVGISWWMVGNTLSALPNNENRARADCQESQGAYRVAYVSQGARDTVIYTSSFSPSSFTQHQVVNEDKDSSPSVAPDVAGFRTSATGFNGGVGFAGFGPRDMWYDASNISVGLEPDLAGNNAPSKYSLFQNYPNPFNPSTTIEFSIPVSGLVKLTVFDILGRKVNTLVNENLAAGSYKFIFDARELPSGAYFYRIEATNFAQTKKMLLLK